MTGVRHGLGGQLLLLHWREMSRNRSNFLFVLLFPFFMLGMFLGMQRILEASIGGGGPDFSVFVVPMALYLAVTGVCMTLTAGPIAEYRQHGTLRILGTTPLSKRAFILTHLVVRLIVVVVLCLAIVLLGVALHVVSPIALLRTVPVTLPAIALFLGVGYAVGGTLSSGQAAMNVATAVQLLTLFASGVAFPMAMLPDSLVRILDFLPTTHFGDLLYWAAASSMQRHSPAPGVAIVSVTAVVMVALAIKLFHWESSSAKG